MTTQARGNAERQFSVPTVEILTLETPKPKAAPAAAAANPASVTAPKRCLDRFANGKRCRQSGLESQAGLCSHHFRLSHPSVVFPPSPSDSEDLSADLLPEPTDFSFVDDVQRFLARLVTQVTASPRRRPRLPHQPDPPFPSRHRPRQGIAKRAPAIPFRPPAPQARRGTRPMTNSSQRRFARNYPMASCMLG